MGNSNKTSRFGSTSDNDKASPSHRPSKPNREKVTESGKTAQFEWVTCAMQGWREHMEDRHIVVQVKLDDKGSQGILAAVFDGHGGD